jgi:DNA helicase-2/ATP-dependent DNA helicase PcrA
MPVNIDDILQQHLNSEQRVAATDPAKQVLTLACAGSGKSRTLAYRIAWLITERDADPASIVAFTFTEKAADSIKLRVADALKQCALDENMIGQMYMGTIHSYCQNLLGRVDARYRQYDVLDENRIKLFLIENYGSLGLQGIRSRLNNRYFEAIKKTAEAWVMMNEEMAAPSDVWAHDPVLGHVLNSLSVKLEESQFLDFSLMQRRAVEALQQGQPGALELAAALHHLLVDEYQDVNPIQEELIRLLHQHQQTLFVVGDDDQSIYGWRGADVTRIQTFKTRYPQAAEHTLAVNYRSTPLIVRVADAFAHQELGAQRISKSPTAANDLSPSEMRVLRFNTRDDEAGWVTAKIAELLGTEYVETNGTRRGLTPADFAILMRSTRQHEPNGHPPRHAAFTMRLAALGIPYSLEAGGGLFDRPHVFILRDGFELLRTGQPTREQAQQFFNTRVHPLFPSADFDQFAAALTRWGRLIHAPIVAGAPRRRINPQQLLFDFLESFDLRHANLDNGVLQDIGTFSEIMQDVETVYPSVDSTSRFQSILNFLNQVAEDGYDTSSNELVMRPDAVTVSTVHKMKGLEFPVVFVVDVENQRFPGRMRQYDGLLPQQVVGAAVARGAYRSTREEEARLFYTAQTRAERFLYVTGCAWGPGWKRPLAVSTFAALLQDPDIVRNPARPTANLVPAPPQRRIETSNLPTSFSDIRYYLQCAKDYQFRKVFGFSPAIPELFGFGKTVHTAVGKLHELHRDTPPTPPEARQIADDTFHLKHVRPSSDPVNRPGPYERAKHRAVQLVESYARDFSADFRQKRQIEAHFEIPVQDAVVSGSIDLVIEEDAFGNVLDACVIDFKAIEGGDDPEHNDRLEWTELALQVQLYARAARDVMRQAIEKGHVHLLKDNQRVTVPVDQHSVDVAVRNAEWAVQGIIAGDFPMRPHERKCPKCDFRQLCAKQPESFQLRTVPPPIRVPGPSGEKMAAALELFDPNYTDAGD